ncbi:unnamed protein product [Sympodiomycopsis kandeliae]
MSSHPARRSTRSRTPRSSLLPSSTTVPISSSSNNTHQESSGHLSSSTATPKATEADPQTASSSSSTAKKRSRSRSTTSASSGAKSKGTQDSSEAQGPSKTNKKAKQQSRQPSSSTTSATEQKSASSVSKGKGKASSIEPDQPEASASTSSSSLLPRKSARLSNKRSLSVSPPTVDAPSSGSKKRRVSKPSTVRARKSSDAQQTSSASMVQHPSKSGSGSGTTSQSQSKNTRRTSSRRQKEEKDETASKDQDHSPETSSLGAEDEAVSASDEHLDGAEEDQEQNPEDEEAEHNDEFFEEGDDDEDDDEGEDIMGAYADEMDDEDGFLDGGGSFAANLRMMAGFLSGAQSRFRTLLTSLRARKDPTTQLVALQDLAEALSLANEESLAGYFSTEAFVRELIYIMGGPKPPSPSNAAAAGSSEGAPAAESTDDDDDEMEAAIAAAGLVDRGEMTLLACRCLANLIEAMPHAAHTVVSLGAVPVLLSKLTEIEFIDLAEQTLQTLEKISVDYPTTIVREGGLMAMLQYLDFFNIHIQRTAMLAASHCCRKLSAEHFDRVREVVPIIRNVLSYADQRLVESACKCVVRMVESYRHQVSSLEGLLDEDLVRALNTRLLQGSPTSASSATGSTSGTSISPSIYTDLLKSFSTAVKASPKIAVTLLEANIVETLYHLLTGSPAPVEDGSGGRGPAALGSDGQGSSAPPAAQLESHDPASADAAAIAIVGGESSAAEGIAVADMAVLQNLAQRPKEQIQEALSLVSELLPPLPRDGVFDPRAYTEKAWVKRRKQERANKEKMRRRSSGSSPSGNQLNGDSSHVGPDAQAALATSPEEPVKIEAAVVKGEKDLLREEAQACRMNMLKERQSLVKRFTQLVLPTLVEVYAASVALHVRQKSLVGMLKVVNFVEPEPLGEVLQNVPFASFVAGILSSGDDPSLVHNVLQLVELLCQKLPDVYKSLLRREGVMWEIADIASQVPTAVKYSSKAVSSAANVATTSQAATSPSKLALPGTIGASEPATSAAGTAQQTSLATSSSSSSSPLDAAGFPRSLLSTTAPATVVKKTETASADSGKDAVIWRARILRDTFNKEAANAEGGADHADKSLATVKALVSSLDKAASSGVEEAKAALSNITALFTKSEEPISSFELLRSGLIDGLCNFASGDSTQLPPSTRQDLLLNALTSSETSTVTSGGASLVRRLQESLSRLENVEIATALGSSPDDVRRTGSLGLHRQFRLRLQSDDADTPKNCNNLVVGIHAIASFERLADFLRPKLNTAAAVASLGSGASGSSRLSSVLAALAGGSGDHAKMEDALAAVLGRDRSEAASPSKIKNGESSKSTADAGTSSQAESSKAPSNPQRRSSRLSGKSSELEAAKEETKPESSSADNGKGKESAVGADEQGGEEEMESDEIAREIMERLMPDEYEGEEGSDEDSGPQIFEDEVGGDELSTSPVQDKTVNLSVAADGKKVEAKTPDGTRIGTPLTSSTPDTSAKAGSSSSPARPSYAAALQRKPTDYHLEFSMHGKKLDLDSTIYAAVHQFETRPGGNMSSASTAGAAGGSSSSAALANSMLQRSIWSNVYTVRFRKVEGPAPTSADSKQTPEPEAASRALAELPASIPAESSFGKILQLLRILHDLNSEWRAVRPGNLANTDKAAAIGESSFVNNKLTAKLHRQLEEPMIVASKCLPEWSLQLPRKFPFLFPFEARYAFLQSTAFGYNRMLQRWQNIANRGNENNGTSSSRLSDNSLAHLVRLPRAKVRIARESILASAFRVMELYGKTDTILEVEYFNEVGTGLGPTLEFYSLASKEFARKDLGMWRDNGPADSQSSYVYAPDGLFPLPISQSEVATSRGKSRLAAFKVIGQFVAKALLDSRIIDCNFSPLFMRAVLNQRFVASLSSLRTVDATLAKSLESLQSMNADDLAALHLDFTLPGDADFELVPGGKSQSVSLDNVGSYISQVADAALGSGIQPLVKAFRQGFNNVFPISAMTSFTADELVMLFGNTEEDWSEPTLHAAIKPDHGYNSESQAFQDLLAIMASFNLAERREFLQWLTGSPKLPIGGFGGLQPRLTVVKRPAEAPLKADDYLASNMSCANFLKLPQYSSREVMKKRLETAVKEGAGSFNLS